MRVMCISAHPDDMELQCAGTLLKCKARGDEVYVCHVNNGSLGHFEIMPDELRVMRIQEAKNACELAGFHHMTCDFGDFESYYQSRDQKNVLVGLIREVNPDFIITMHPDDYMCDHVAASKLVFDAAFMASVPHYMPEIPATDKVVPIYYMETAYGIDFVPTEYVDITEFFDKKIEMLLCHKSQSQWLEEHDNVDYTEGSRIISMFRGLQCGVKYAEAFVQCKAALKMVPQRLLP